MPIHTTTQIEAFSLTARLSREKTDYVVKHHESSDTTVRNAYSEHVKSLTTILAQLAEPEKAT